MPQYLTAYIVLFIVFLIGFGVGYLVKRYMVKRANKTKGETTNAPKNTFTNY